MSSTANKKKIVVFPAAGWQGRSTCQALSEDPQYSVVGIARNLESPKISSASSLLMLADDDLNNQVGGIDLKKLNIELVEGDFKDPESYKPHLQGAYGLFVNTDFWTLWGENGFSEEEAKKKELKYGQDVIAAAKEAGVQHFVFSSLYEGAKDLDPDSFVFTAIKLNKLLESSGVPYTIYYSGAYYENLVHLNMIKPQEDGSVLIDMMCPDATTQMWTSNTSIGAFVKAIFDDKKRFAGKEVLNTTEWNSWGSLATRLDKLSAKKVYSSNITDEQWNHPQRKQGMGIFWDTMNSLYTKSQRHHFEGTTGTQVVSNLPTFEEWAKTDPTVKAALGI